VTLAELLDAAAADVPIPPDRRTAADGSVEFVHEGTVFAALDAAGRTASFRLDDVLAAAAQRTPDAAGSTRGQAWVAFTPAQLDGHAVDRARAWFAAAHRRATGRAASG
jgi:hypothetical protein